MLLSVNLLFLGVCTQAAAIQSGEELESAVQALTQRHYPHASQEYRDSLGVRFTAALAGYAGRPDAAAAKETAEGLIRSVLGTAESSERQLAALAPPIPTATRQLPKEMHLEGYELSARLVEAILGEELAYRAPGPNEVRLIEGQIGEVVAHWKQGVSMIIGGKCGPQFIEAIGADKERELKENIGKAFCGLRSPLSNSQMDAVRSHVWTELSGIKDRYEVEEERIAEIFRLGVGREALALYADLPKPLRDHVDQLRSAKNGLGNLLHVIWNYSHPRAAPIILEQDELRSRIEKWVREIQQREGTIADAQYQRPEFASKPRSLDLMRGTPEPRPSTSGKELSSPSAVLESANRSTGGSSSENEETGRRGLWIGLCLLLAVALLIGVQVLRSKARASR